MGPDGSWGTAGHRERSQEQVSEAWPKGCEFRGISERGQHVLAGEEPAGHETPRQRTSQHRAGMVSDE